MRLRVSVPVNSGRLHYPGNPLDIAARACRPTCRRAFARFSTTWVVRTAFLLNFLRDFGRERERSSDEKRASCPRLQALEGPCLGAFPA